MSLLPENAMNVHFESDGTQVADDAHLSEQSIAVPVSMQTDEAQSFSPMHGSPSAFVPLAPGTQHATGRFDVPTFSHRVAVSGQS